MVIVFFIIFMLVMFLVLVFIMRSMLTKNVTSATNHLDELAREYAKKEDEVKKQLESAKRQSQEILSNAMADAQKQKEELLKKGADEKQKIISDAHLKADEVIAQADRARMALLADINSKIHEKAIAEASILLERSLPDDLRKELHLYWLKNLANSTFEQLSRLHVPDGTTHADISTAFALTLEQKKDLTLRIKDKLGVELEIKEELNPKLIAGVVVNIGGLILDGSLKFRIQEVASFE